MTKFHTHKHTHTHTHTVISVMTNPLGAFSLKGHFLKLHFRLQWAASYSSPFISNRKCKHNAFWEMPSGSVNEGSSLVSGHTLPGIQLLLLTTCLSQFPPLSFCCLTLFLFVSHLVSWSHTFGLSLPSTCSFFSFCLLLVRSFSHFIPLKFLNFSLVESLKVKTVSCFSHSLFRSPVYHSSFFLFSPFLPHLSSFTSPSLSLPTTLKVDLTPYKTVWRINAGIYNQFNNFSHNFSLLLNPLLLLLNQ